MHCPKCGDDTLAFAVPEEFVEHLPHQSRFVAVCTTCLTVVPVEDAPPGPPEFSRISTHLPDDPDAAVPLLLAVGLLDHLALYREAITALLTEVERAGVDPILVLERLADDPSLEPHFDLDRRVHQVIQLYE
jgi:hypothetical protein